MADALGDIVATNNNTHLGIVGRDLEEIPQELHGRFGSAVESLDFSFNQISKVEHLDRFVKLKSLVLDNNNICDVSHFPAIQTLETLWINNNKIDDLDALLEIVEKRLPNLSYLSILKNPACPDEVSGSDVDDYQRYRYYVLHRLKKLKFLDSRKVEEKERKEAQKRGQFCKVVKPDYDKLKLLQQQQPQQADNLVVLKPLESSEAAPMKQTSDSYFGYTKQVYKGTNSEGNRFIPNDFL